MTGLRVLGGVRTRAIHACFEHPPFPNTASVMQEILSHTAHAAQGDSERIEGSDASLLRNIAVLSLLTAVGL